MSAIKEVCSGPFRYPLKSVPVRFGTHRSPFRYFRKSVPVRFGPFQSVSVSRDTLRCRMTWNIKDTKREGLSLSHSLSVCLSVCLSVSLSRLIYIYVLVKLYFHYTKHAHACLHLRRYQNWGRNDLEGNDLWGETSWRGEDSIGAKRLGYGERNNQGWE